VFSDVLLFCLSPTNNSVDTHNSQCITPAFVLTQPIVCIPPECPLMISNVDLLTQDDKWFLQDFKRRCKPERFVL